MGQGQRAIAECVESSKRHIVCGVLAVEDTIGFGVLWRPGKGPWTRPPRCRVEEGVAVTVRGVRVSVDEARPGGDGAGGGAEEEMPEVGLGGCPGGGGVEERWVEGEFWGHFFGTT